MSYRPRVYVHSPRLERLTPARREIRQQLVDRILQEGFEPQEFGMSGLPLTMGWSFDQANSVLEQCQGALIVALAKYEDPAPLPSEYAHFEGALALAKHLPTLIFTEPGTAEAGILNHASGIFVHTLPLEGAAQYLAFPTTQQKFAAWADEVRARGKVFLGYCSEAQATADALSKFIMKGLGLETEDWAVDFAVGSTILGEIQQKIDACRFAVFLFTRDDPLAGEQDRAAPRDNVVFEAGYCMARKGPRRTIIIREEGAKMPADLGGSIYLPLRDRGDISPLQEKLRATLSA